MVGIENGEIVRNWKNGRYISKYPLEYPFSYINWEYVELRWV